MFRSDMRFFFARAGMRDSLEADIRVSWFLRLIAARIRVNGRETDFCVRAAWKQLLPAKEEEEPEEAENFPKENQESILEVLMWKKSGIQNSVFQRRDSQRKGFQSKNRRKRDGKTKDRRKKRDRTGQRIGRDMVPENIGSLE